MDKKKEIGGYFELELPLKDISRKVEQPWILKSGRSSLKKILKLLNPCKIYVPFFSCHVIIEALETVGIPYEWYSLDSNLEVNLELKNKEFLLYINYFGLKRNYAQELSQKHESQLIIDNTHDFFFPRELAKKSWIFNSIRKFLGVPDGSFLFAPENYIVNIQNLKRNTNINVEHLVCRFESGAFSGYKAFQKNEINLGIGMERCSVLTEVLLKNIDLKNVEAKRKANFDFLHKHLSKKNQWTHIVNEKNNNSAFTYPYMPFNFIPKEWFWEEKIFVPILWKECITDVLKFSLEKKLAESIIHLPIDHRYGITEMKVIINKIEDFEKRIAIGKA